MKNDADIIIIGGGCAGMSAAIYAARAGKGVLVLEGEGIGGQIASSPSVENYPGIEKISGVEFSDNLYAQAESCGAQFDFGSVTGIRIGDDMEVRTEESVMHCKSIIIAAGAKHRMLKVKREEEFIGHGVSYCAVCDGAFYKNMDVAVVGGGSTALQTAEYLCKMCSSVTLIHRRDSFRAEDALVNRVLAIPNLNIETDSVVEELLGEEELTGVMLKNTKSEEYTKLDVEGLFVSIGQDPQNEPFEDMVKLDEEGYIITDEDCMTSVPGVFAAGDCRHKKIRQLTTAAADGTIAAIAACSFIDSKTKL